MNNIDEKEYLDFFKKLDRKDFLSDSLKSFADFDFPLSIGYGQTISQPTLVLEMTILLDLKRNFKVLEIGTGSGYQTAFLAHFCKEVYTIERYAALSTRAEKVLSKLNFANIHFLVGDGSDGWLENAPFDRIIVTAAAARLPEALIQQLKTDGKLMIPYGSSYFQALLLISKDDQGNIKKETLDYVRFVEFVGKYGWH